MGVYLASDLADTHYVGVCFVVGLVHLYVISGLPGLVCLLVGLAFSTGQFLFMAHVMGQPNEKIRGIISADFQTKIYKASLVLKIFT